MYFKAQIFVIARVGHKTSTIPMLHLKARLEISAKNNVTLIVALVFVTIAG